MMPMIESAIIGLVKLTVASGNIGRVKRRKPYVPIFSRTLARITLPAVGASTCASGNQGWKGNNGTFSDNVVRNSTGGQWLLWLGWFYDGQRADGWTITGNTFRELRATPQHMVTVHDATNCTITGNTFQTAAPSFPRGTPVACSGVNTGTTISNNNVVLSK